MALDILIVDDEADIRLLTSGILEDEGYQTREAGTSSGALECVSKRRPALVLLDIWLQGSELDGLGILKEIKKTYPEVPVLMMSGHGTVETAVSAIKQGAYDFIEKPFKADRLVFSVERAIEAARLRREVEDLKQRTDVDSDLVGVSTGINQIRQVVERVAETNSRVLITGPSGSGKEVVARMIHAHSQRKTGPFVVLNCATMHSDHLEAELFGVEEGDNVRSGTFEAAHGGTLFLDGVTDMSTETQGRIVRVLQEQIFQRVGGMSRIEVDVRVMASATRDLQDEIAAGRFREDLFYRLSVVPIEMPQLNSRREDIPHLAEYFMKCAVKRSGKPARTLADDALAALQGYDWPGNVRELRNIIERMLILAPGLPGDPIHADMLPVEVGNGAPVSQAVEGSAEIMGLPLREAREIFEREYLTAQVNRFGGNISKTATFVGMERSALHRKLKSLGFADEMKRG